MIGSAKAETPLLEKPLEGPVYLRSAPENKSGLPDIVAALNGQIDIDFVGKIDTVHKSLRTSFETVPDAPVSKFALSLDGGQKGSLGKQRRPLQDDLGGRCEYHRPKRPDGEPEALLADLLSARALSSTSGTCGGQRWWVR